MTDRLSYRFALEQRHVVNWRRADAFLRPTENRRPPWLYGAIWIMAATALVGIANARFEVALFLVYVSVIVGITASFGLAWGLSTAALAWLLSTYLFLPPRFGLALDSSLLMLVPHYFGSATLCHFVRKARRRRAAAQQLLLRLPGRYIPSNN